MADLLSLPPEILHRICSCANLPTRKVLRLTNSLLSEIAEQWVFASLNVSPLLESCERLQNVLVNPRLAAHTTKIYLMTYDLDEDGDYMHYVDAEDEDYEPADEVDLPQRFWELFGRLRDFPRLQSVALIFHPEHSNNEWQDVPQELEAFRAPVTKKAFGAFASLPLPLKELVIRDLHNAYEEDPTVLDNINTVLTGLQSLRLNITNEHREYHRELDYRREEAHEYYQAIPSFWLKPTTATLQHLTLYSSVFCGFYPRLDFRGLHFPQLRGLALGNYGFVHDSQLDWILEHGETLAELYLDDCAILHEVSIKDIENTYLPSSQFTQKDGLLDNLYASYKARWADYFRAFETLPRLRHFRYGHCPDGWTFNSAPFEQETQIEIGLHEESYLVFCDGFGPSPYMSELIYRYPKADGDGMDYVHGTPVTPSDEDREALVRLCTKLGQSVPPPSEE
ncbi:uncharacterized protein DSM5745_11270 [Aspergillus mulundensis]|uniref:F-box domain-containing protein n=1 Tax=Aspergillus mulundensis TaxID=1810919 RepID=A0A3D8Q9V4_9EURO|nr:hypothetical protein DSM5745_11270 [Aspergillus mulundensis]RDW58579.1 hypothetical protein DSM5745_11270 [Aspergillus mulundensis]